MKQKTKSYSIKVVVIVIAVVAINYIGDQFYKRFDLTADQRYTLSDAALQTIDEVDSPIIIDVFLEGDFPSEFRRLRDETRQLLEEFRSFNKNINFGFINPIADESTRRQNLQQLNQRGLRPFR